MKPIDEDKVGSNSTAQCDLDNDADLQKADALPVLFKMRTVFDDLEPISKFSENLVIVEDVYS